MLIEKYTPNWICNFEDIKKELEKGLQGLNYTIEHVGSTSVPDLDSKPIIDIDIVYTNQVDFEEIKSKLLKIGYYHNGNQGIEYRDVFKRNSGMTNEVLDKIAHHLYVCQSESKALERHILFRNFLRRNKWAKEKYQQMKYELTEKANQDKKKYAALKELYVNDFIDSIINEERTWREVNQKQ